MGYIPIFLDVTGRRCMVVGGGEVATRKVESLLEAGAAVVIVSPNLCALLAAIVDRGMATHIARAYRRGDIAGCVLVYAATDDPAIHREIAEETRALSIPLNVVDVPELCTFIAPAVAKQGDLQIAISTGGASPAFAAWLRRELEKQFGSEYGIALKVLRAARRRLHSEEIDPVDRMRRLKDLAESPILDAIRTRDWAELNRILALYLGDGVNLAALGLDTVNRRIADGPKIEH